MKKFLIILSLAVFLGGWLYFYKIHRTPSAIEYTDITSTQLKTMLQKKDFYFINVHTPYEGEIEKTAKNIGSEVIIISDEGQDAKQFQNLTKGIGAILRFQIE